MPDPIITPAALGAGLSLVPPIIDIAKRLRAEKGTDPTFSEILDGVREATKHQLRMIRHSIGELESALQGLDLNKSFDDLLREHDSWLRFWDWGIYRRIEVARQGADDAHRAIRDGMGDLVKLMICNKQQEFLAELGLSDRGKGLREKLIDLDRKDVSVNEMLSELRRIIDDLLAEVEAI